MSRFEACLFDYGNTVVEFDQRQIEYILDRLLEAFCPMAGPLEMGVLKRAMERVCSLPHSGDPPDLRELSPRRQMELLLGYCYNHQQPAPDLVEECDRVLQELFVESITIDEKTVRFLSGLRCRLPMGLVSNYPCGRALRRSLSRSGIAGLLDPVVISGEVGYVKPHVSLFEVALESLSVPAERVLFVGDRWDMDMVGAHQAGMVTCHHVGFTTDRDLDDRYRTYRPDFTINHLSELENILES